jgi:hypothetical protein
VDRLKLLTYPCGEIPPDGCPEESDGASDEISGTPVSEFRGGCAEISTDPYSKFPQTNTEITTKTSTEISIHPSSSGEDAADGLTDTQIAEQVISEITTAQRIPYAYSQSSKKMQAAIRWLCEYDFYTEHPCNMTDLKTKDRFDNFVLLVNSLVSMATRAGTQTYSGEQTDACAVIDAINAASVCCGCGSLSEMIFSALDDFTVALASTHIKNYAGYAKAVLWNCLTVHRVRQNVKYAVM